MYKDYIAVQLYTVYTSVLCAYDIYMFVHVFELRLKGYMVMINAVYI